MQPNHPTPDLGQSLAQRYRLERVISRTEAGILFEALDRVQQRHVMIEAATSLEEPEAAAKWKRDAMVAQRLDGEHVLRVLDVGLLGNGVPFIVTEPVLSSLATELAVRRRVPIARAVGWTLEIAEAIAEAHALGLAHGDLRVDNVFVARGGNGPSIKVAWATAAKAEGAAKEDAQRDVAALGAILRMLTTGSANGADDAAPTLPDGLATVVARALAAPEKNGHDGFANVAELARALAPWAPPGHASARMIAFLGSRAASRSSSNGRPEATEPSFPEPLPKASLPPSHAPPAHKGPSPSLSDDWFARPTRDAARTSARAALLEAPHERSAWRSAAFAAVSIGLVGAALGVTWMLFSAGKLPRWTGAAPPDEVGSTEVTSAPTQPEPATTADSGLAPIELPAPAPSPPPPATVAPTFAPRAAPPPANPHPRANANPAIEPAPFVPPAPSPVSSASAAPSTSAAPSAIPSAPATDADAGAPGTTTTPSASGSSSPEPPPSAYPWSSMPPEQEPRPAPPETKPPTPIDRNPEGNEPAPKPGLFSGED